MKDFYSILGIAENSDQPTIKARYRQLARELHPDMTGGDKRKTEKLKDVIEAYAVLGHVGRRAEFDASRKTGRHPMFGVDFDNLVAKIRQQGIHGGNLDDILADFFDFAKKMKKDMPAHVAKAQQSPGSLLGLLEDLFGDDDPLKPFRK